MCCQVDRADAGRSSARIAVRLLDQQAIAEVEHVAVEGQPVAIARLREQRVA